MIINWTKIEKLCKLTGGHNWKHKVGFNANGRLCMACYVYSFETPDGDYIRDNENTNYERTFYESCYRKNHLGENINPISEALKERRLES